ncbi:MAG: hypothetical protein ACI855_001326, partial [Myxococcota bacterium]
RVLRRRSPELAGVARAVSTTSATPRSSRSVRNTTTAPRLSSSSGSWPWSRRRMRTSCKPMVCSLAASPGAGRSRQLRPRRILRTGHPYRTGRHHAVPATGPGRSCCGVCSRSPDGAVPPAGADDPARSSVAARHVAYPGWPRRLGRPSPA